MNTRDHLLMTAVNQKILRFVGNLTEPRSYGVYEIERGGSAGKRFRFGNHPVRLNELERDFGSCSIKAVFLKRDRAKALADYLNNN